MKIKLILSAVLGIMYGFGVFLLFPLVGIDVSFFDSVLAGVMFGATMMMVLITSELYNNHKYRKIEKHLLSPPTHTFEVNFNMGTEVRSGRMYFCSDIIYLVSIDKKPHIADGILKGTVSRCEIENVTTIHIFTTDLRKFVVGTADANKICEYIEKDGWM